MSSCLKAVSVVDARPLGRLDHRKLGAAWNGTAIARVLSINGGWQARFVPPKRDCFLPTQSPQADRPQAASRTRITGMSEAGSADCTANPPRRPHLLPRDRPDKPKIRFPVRQTVCGARGSRSGRSFPLHSLQSPWPGRFRRAPGIPGAAGAHRSGKPETGR